MDVVKLQLCCLPKGLWNLEELPQANGGKQLHRLRSNAPHLLLSSFWFLCVDQYLIYNILDSVTSVTLLALLFFI